MKKPARQPRKIEVVEDVAVATKEPKTKAAKTKAKPAAESTAEPKPKAPKSTKAKPALTDATPTQPEPKS